MLLNYFSKVTVTIKIKLISVKVTSGICLIKADVIMYSINPENVMHGRKSVVMSV